MGRPDLAGFVAAAGVKTARSGPTGSDRSKRPQPEIYANSNQIQSDTPVSSC